MCSFAFESIQQDIRAPVCQFEAKETGDAKEHHQECRSAPNAGGEDPHAAVCAGPPVVKKMCGYDIPKHRKTRTR